MLIHLVVYPRIKFVFLFLIDRRKK